MFTPTLKTLALIAAVTTAGAGPQAGGGGAGWQHAATRSGTCSAPVVQPPRVHGCSEGPAAPVPARLRSKTFHHARHHQRFPAGRDELLASLTASAELTPEELGWLWSRLEPRTYRSGAELLRALFPDAPAAVLARLEPPLLTHAGEEVGQ